MPGRSLDAHYAGLLQVGIGVDVWYVRFLNDNSWDRYATG